MCSIEVRILGKRRQSKRAHARQKQALGAQHHLIGLLEGHQHLPVELIDSAAVHLMKITRRHRLRLPSTHRHLVCRACWAPHTRSTNVRVRIKAGQRLTTCMVCGDLRRYGGGPKAHRQQPTEVSP